ncbi:SseB family protein [Actinomadura litoris]|uniref:SseB family protein n=1 Tax=Actinomadura litoris TaxID=2678616 RepID=UPI001FA76AAF|nr:SseB family protein [Actinomadura litoris]
MADAWRPTSELERRLQDSVRTGDQEGYFRLLADSELLVPVPPGAVDDLLANTSHPSWPVQEEEGRVHVLVYTSPAAMHACLGQTHRHFMTLRFRDLAEAWPDPRWWLAVDVPAGHGAPLPIEARMPAWFIRQVAEGDVRPPQVGRPVQPEQPDAHGSVPAPARHAAQERPGAPSPHAAGSEPQHPAQAPHAAQVESSTRGEHTAQAEPVALERPATPIPHTTPVEPPAQGRPTAPEPATTQARIGAREEAASQEKPDAHGNVPAPTQHAAQAPPVAPEQPPTQDGPTTPGPSTPQGQLSPPDQHTAQAPASAPGQHTTQGPSPAQGQPSAPEQQTAQGQHATQGPSPAQGYPDASEQHAAQGQHLAQGPSTTQAQPSAPEQHTAQGQHAAQGPSTTQGQPSASEQHTAQEPSSTHGQPGAPEQQTAQAQHTAQGPSTTQGQPSAPGPHAGQEAPGVVEPEAVRGEARAPEQSGARDEGSEQAQHAAPGSLVGPPGQHAVPGQVPYASQGDEVSPQGDAGEWEELQAQHRGLQREGARPAFQPANEVERELLRAAANNDHDLFLQTMAGAEVLLPTPEDMDYTLRPGRAGFPWQTREVDGATVVPVFTSPERLIEAARAAGTGNEYIKVPFTVVLRYWPDQGWPLAINSGSPAGGTILAQQLPGLARWADQRAVQRMADGFEPQNDVEQRLFEAAARRDTDAFFKVLLGAQVLVPAEPETPWGIAPDDPDFPWRPVPVHGEVCVQLFTSLKWMNEAIGSSRFVMPTLLEMVSAWPDVAWTLVLNPGTPIDATMPGEQVRALSGQPREDVPAPEAVTPEVAEAPPEPRPAEPEFEPGNRIDQELYEATLGGDSDAFLRVLLNANVLVPIPADAPLEVTPVQNEFRWDAALQDATSVQVFTSLVRLREVLPEARFVYADFRELIAAWPREDWAMLLNPGTRIGASLRGDQVRALSEWAVRVGLVPARPEAPLPPPEPSPLVTAHDVVRELPPPVVVEDVPQEVARQPEPYFEGDRVMQPTIMQKVVPHGHVGWYLDQGYDRVGGFVHPTGDVTELQTPVQLYEALGLLYEDTSFSPTDEGVYVIRWPAYCPDLYRTPFGGQDEAELAAWGEAGWVIERAPFLGSGFAPGSAGSIREYKVDSVRLPYGAEMYYLGHDRSERFVAMYDPDRLAWLRPDAATGPDGWDGRSEAAQ